MNSRSQPCDELFQAEGKTSAMVLRWEHSGWFEGSMEAETEEKLRGRMAEDEI